MIFHSVQRAIPHRYVDADWIVVRVFGIRDNVIPRRPRKSPKPDFCLPDQPPLAGISHLTSGTCRALPMRAISQPIQTEHVFLGVAQPGRNFSHLKRLISRAEVAIHQICDFFSRARLLDLVQGSQDMLIETVVRTWNLAHLRFSGRADLLKGAHFVFGLLPQNKNSDSGRTGRYQLENQSANCLRLMLPAPAKVYVRSKPLSLFLRITKVVLVAPFQCRVASQLLRQQASGSAISTDRPLYSRFLLHGQINLQENIRQLAKAVLAPMCEPIYGGYGREVYCQNGQVALIPMSAAMPE